MINKKIFHFWGSSYFKRYDMGVFKEITNSPSIASSDGRHISSLTKRNKTNIKRATLYYPIVKAALLFKSVCSTREVVEKEAISNVEIINIYRYTNKDALTIDVGLSVKNSEGVEIIETTRMNLKSLDVTLADSKNNVQDYNFEENKGYSLFLAYMILVDNVCNRKVLPENFLNVTAFKTDTECEEIGEILARLKENTYVSLDDMFLLCDHIYRLFEVEDYYIKLDLFGEQPKGVCETIYGKKGGLSKERKTKTTTIAELRKKYAIGEEKVDDMENYIPSETLEMVADMTKNVGMRKFMFRGAAGCGKTTDAKALARVLGLPRFVFTCSENTDEMSLISTFVPDNGEFKMVNSSIVDACTMPSVCEIQEPACISKPATLVALNSLLDDDAIIRLVSGETIKKNPDTIFVFTTNVDYRGCRDINESVLSRMDMIIDYPDVQDMVLADRVINKYKGQIKDENIIRNMAFCITQTQKYMEVEGIVGGVCGPREYENWVRMYLHTNDIFESCKSTVISKISTDKEVREEVLSYVRLQFA